MSYLAHHGIKGQKWGIRRYQNDDGSLNAAGRDRYGVKERKVRNNATYNADNRRLLRRSVRDAVLGSNYNAYHPEDGKINPANSIKGVGRSIKGSVSAYKQGRQKLDKAYGDKKVDKYRKRRKRAMIAAGTIAGLGALGLVGAGVGATASSAAKNKKAQQKHQAYLNEHENARKAQQMSPVSNYNARDYASGESSYGNTYKKSNYMTGSNPLGTTTYAWDQNKNKKKH